MTTVLVLVWEGWKVATIASLSTLFCSPSEETGPNPQPEVGAMPAATTASTDIGKASETRIITGMCKLCRNPSMSISTNKQEKRLKLSLEQLKLLLINQNDLGSNSLDSRDNLLITVISPVSQIAIFRVYQSIPKSQVSLN